MQQEFEQERLFIKQEIENDYFLNRFFEVFLFEKNPPSSNSPVNVYSQEIFNSDIYIGLIGSDYGNILESGISPTEYEYDLFNKLHRDSFIFMKDVDFRDEKVDNFIKKIQNERTYKRFRNRYELFFEIRKSLGDFLDKNLKNSNSFDSKILINSSFDDVDVNAVNMFFDVLEYEPTRNLLNNFSLTRVLATIKAGAFVDGEFKLNNTGALFFAKDLSKFGINNEVKFVRFFDNDGIKTFDKYFVNDSLFNILKEAESFFYKTTSNISEIKGFKRVTVHEYPYSAIREALVNALAHRDYRIQNSPITFYIYPDYIEIKSPGCLEYPLKLSRLGKDNPVHRNPYITNILSQTWYMEHVGTGIKRMREEMRSFNLSEPEFSESGEFFKVVFRGNSNHNNLNVRQKTFLKLRIDEITTQEYMDLFDISRNTAVSDLKHLMDVHYVDKKKNGRVVFYKIKN